MPEKASVTEVRGGRLATACSGRPAVFSDKPKERKPKRFPLSKVGADSQIRTGDLILTNSILTILNALLTAVKIIKKPSDLAENWHSPPFNCL